MLHIKREVSDMMQHDTCSFLEVSLYHSCEALWLRSLKTNLAIKVKVPGDNQAAIYICETLVS